MKTTELKKVLSLIEKHKAKISKERDILRDLFSDLEELLETLDSGIDSIESGAREIKEGIDYLSQQC